jgi:hypothetical protein
LFLEKLTTRKERLCGFGQRRIIRQDRQQTRPNLMAAGGEGLRAFGLPENFVSSSSASAGRLQHYDRLPAQDQR